MEETAVVEFNVCAVKFPEEIVRNFVLKDDFKNIELMLDTTSTGLIGKQIVKNFKDEKVIVKKLVVTRNGVKTLQTPDIQNINYELRYYNGLGLVEHLSITLTDEIQ